VLFLAFSTAKMPNELLQITNDGYTVWFSTFDGLDGRPYVVDFTALS